MEDNKVDQGGGGYWGESCLNDRRLTIPEDKLCVRYEE